MQNKNRKSIIQKSWFQGILAFCFVQVLFIIMELTGWIPNLKDFDGKLFGNIMNSGIINDWFTFYNTEFFNLITVFLGVILLAQICFVLMQSLFFKKSL